MPRRAVSRALSLLGEHSAVWLLIAGLGAFTRPARSQEWAKGAGTVLTAHAASVALKRLLRRPRPAAADRLAPVRGELSFPSSHATAAAAAAVAFRGLVPRAALWPLATGIACSRLRLRVHHPRDVVGGAVLGWVVAAGCSGTGMDPLSPTADRRT